MNKRTIYLAEKFFTICLLLSLLLVEGCKKQQEALDYSKLENWAYYGIGDKNVNLFIICPTVDMGKDNNFNMSISDEKTKANFIGALNMEKGIYEDSCSLYAPYYRQATFPVYSLTTKDSSQYFEIAYTDVKAAFEFFADKTGDTPFVLAGFSQGSDMIIRLMKDLFKNKKYQNRLIASYAIGWRITDSDLKECPWLKMAQSENDTGVIISFNSEAENISDSLTVPANCKTYSINPLNWKTDNTLAPLSLNNGACFTDYSGTVRKEISNFCSAYLDKTRGTLKLPDVNPQDYLNSLFPDGVYHLYDYQFFFRNLQNNVETRVKAFSKL